MYLKDMESFSQIFGFKNICIYLVVALVNTFLLLMTSYKYLQAMQQCSYDASEYKKWLHKKENVYILRHALLSMLSALLFLLTSVALLFMRSPVAYYLGFIFYIAFTIQYFAKDKKLNTKVPLRFTRRMIRQVCTYAVLLYILSLLACFVSDAIFYPLKDSAIIGIRYVFVCFTPLLLPWLVLLSFWINSPFENKNNLRYIRRSKEKLSSYSNLIKIGITGSYGKTSVKNILTAMLERKYKVLCTPQSFNTPLGISRTVRYLDDTYEVFVAEMGARHKGDIKELCDIVKPDYAVMCGITKQHIETFHTIENIKDTKYELIENIKGNYAVFSGDSDETVELFNRCDKDKVLAGIDGKNGVRAENIRYSADGSVFILNIDGEKIECRTKLLGRGNVSNICLAAAMAHKMGVSSADIRFAVANLESTPHRLQAMTTESGVTVVDDSYNCNPKGVEIALEVLEFFEGRKIVVTPGMVEQGKEEDELNYAFGKQLAKVADVVIPVGRYGAYKIRDALIDEGFNAENIKPAKTLEDAKKILSDLLNSGDAVLFENDLPDKFA